MSARRACFFWLLRVGRKRSVGGFTLWLSQVFGRPMCKARWQKREGKRKTQKGFHNSQEMNSNSQFIKAIHIFGRFHHPIDVLRTDFSTRFFRRTDDTSARSSATGDLFDVNGGFPRRLRDLLTRFDFFFEISSSFILCGRYEAPNKFKCTNNNTTDTNRCVPSKPYFLG